MTPFLRVLQQVATRFPVLTLVCIVAISVGMGYAATRLRVANDPQEFLPNHPLAQASKQIEAEFGASHFAQTVYVRFVAKPNQLVESAPAVLDMESVLPDYVKVLRRELHGGDEAYAQLPPENATDGYGYALSDLVRMTLHRMTLAKRFVSAQGTAIVTATIGREADLLQVAREVETRLVPLRSTSQATEFSVFSYGALINQFNRATRSDVKIFLPLAAALALLAIAWVFRYTDLKSLGLIGLLWACIAAISLSPNLAGTAALVVATLVLAILFFRRLSNLFLPFATVLLAGLWTFGLLGLSGMPLNFLMLAVIPLLLGVGIDYPVYLLYRYEEERQAGHAGPIAISNAFIKVGRALTLTTLTSIAGFSSLIGINSPPVQAFGMLSNFAILSSFLVTLLFVPAVKQLLHEPARPSGSFAQNRLGQALAWYADWMNRRVVSVVILLIVAGMSLIFYINGNTLKTVAYDPRRLLPQDQVLVQLYDDINDEFHTYDEVQILIEGDVTRLEAMRSLIVDIPSRLAASPYTQKMMSIAQYVDDLRNANQLVEQTFEEKIRQGDPPVAYRWVFDHIFSRPKLREEAETLLKADSQGRYTALLMRVNTLRSPDQASITHVAQDISARLSEVKTELASANLQMTVTGAPFLQSLSLAVLQDSLYRSLILSVILCALIMMIVLRSITWGLIGIVPVALAAWLVVGTIRATGLELSVATAMVTAISIGLGVDYAIHWVQRFREEGDLRHATARTGEALFGDYLTTLAAFISLIFGQILWNRDFGILAATAMSYAFGLTVLVFPALLSLVRPWIHVHKEV